MTTGLDKDAVRFGADGLVPAVVQDAATGRVLMVGYMNRESLQRTLDDSLVTFWSRGRRELWQKGATSGNRLQLVAVSADCDGDALLVTARPEGPTCHTGEVSCFPAAPARRSCSRADCCIGLAWPCGNSRASSSKCRPHARWVSAFSSSTCGFEKIEPSEATNVSAAFPKYIPRAVESETIRMKTVEVVVKQRAAVHNAGDPEPILNCIDGFLPPTII